MKIYPCIESTVDFYYGDKIIRLWIDEQVVLTNANDYKVDDMVNGIMDFLEANKLAGPKELAEHMAASPNFGRVNAMQVKDDEGVVQRGVVIYFKDFSTDIHG